MNFSAFITSPPQVPRSCMLDKAPCLTIGRVIWILASDICYSICQLNQCIYKFWDGNAVYCMLVSATGSSCCEAPGFFHQFVLSGDEQRTAGTNSWQDWIELSLYRSLSVNDNFFCHWPWSMTIFLSLTRVNDTFLSFVHKLLSLTVVNDIWP